MQVSEPAAKGETVALWVGAAVLFGLGIWGFRGGPLAEQYFAGYLVEQSLSVDNLFVFILVFRYFKTPKLAQDKVCTTRYLVMLRISCWFVSCQLLACIQRQPV